MTKGEGQFLSSLPTRFMRAGGMAMLVVSIFPLLVAVVNGNLWVLVQAGILVAAGLWLTVVLRHPSRPVLEINGGRITYGSVFWLSRRSVELSDLVEVGAVEKDRLPVRLRSGETVSIPLREIRPEQRARAVELVRTSASDGA